MNRASSLSSSSIQRSGATVPPQTTKRPAGSTPSKIRLETLDWPAASPLAARQRKSCLTGPLNVVTDASPLTFPVSSKGRTRDFESLNRGSNPCTGTKPLLEAPCRNRRGHTLPALVASFFQHARSSFVEKAHGTDAVAQAHFERTKRQRRFTRRRAGPSGCSTTRIFRAARDRACCRFGPAGTFRGRCQRCPYGTSLAGPASSKPSRLLPHARQERARLSPRARL